MLKINLILASIFLLLYIPVISVIFYSFFVTTVEYLSKSILRPNKFTIFAALFANFLTISYVRAISANLKQMTYAYFTGTW